MSKIITALLLFPLMNLCALEFQGITIKNQEDFTKAIQGTYSSDLAYGTAHGEKWSKPALQFGKDMGLRIRGLTETVLMKGKDFDDPETFIFDKIEGERVYAHYKLSPAAAGEDPEIPVQIIFSFDGPVLIQKLISDLPPGSKLPREETLYWRIKK